MNKTIVKPLGDNVLVRPVKIDKKTSSGIFLPENASNEKPQEGKIIAVGDSKEIKVKKGQLVIFRRYSGTEIKIDGEDNLIVKNEDILAVVD